MSKKVSEMIDNIDCSHLDNIEHGEGLREDISLDRIKSRAMGVVFENKNRKNKRRWSKMIIIPAAAIITLMSITAFALSSYEPFREFFGDSISFITDKIQPIQKSYTKNGIIFTVENAVIDDTSGLIMFSLVKKDGTAFDENTTLGDIKLNTGDGYGFGRRIVLSENNKKLLCYIDIHNNGKLYGKKLSLAVENLVTSTSGEKQTDIDLFELYINNPNDFKAVPITPTGSDGPTGRPHIAPIFYHQMDISYRIKPMEQLPQYGVLGALYMDGKLIVITELSMPKGNSSSYADIYRLVDTRNGEGISSIQATQTTRSGREDTGISYSEIIFEIGDIENLKYLKPIVNYNLKEMDVEGDWAVNFSLKKNVDLIESRPNLTFEKQYDNETHIITIKEMFISAVGIRVENSSVSKTTGSVRLPRFEDSYILMKNGEQIKLTSTTLGLNNPEEHTVYFRADGFIDVENIEAVYIAGQRLPVK